jgi:transcription elongation factor SPT6
MAVGVGRLALDPLAVVATLFGPRRPIVSLHLHDLQDSLPQDLLATRLEQVGWCVCVC